MIELCSESPVRTRRIGASLASLVRPGDVLLLDGDLGAGKTTLTQGLAEALGVAEPVTSPTFTLVRTYPTTAGFELLHVDVYRLERLHEIVDLALPEQIEEGAVAVIEWGERAAPALLPRYLHVRFALGAGEDERLITLNTTGEGWDDRRAELQAALT